MAGGGLGWALRSLPIQSSLGFPASTSLRATVLPSPRWVVPNHSVQFISHFPVFQDWFFSKAGVFRISSLCRNSCYHNLKMQVLYLGLLVFMTRENSSKDGGKKPSLKNTDFVSIGCTGRVPSHSQAVSESGKDCQAPTGPKPEGAPAAASSPSFTCSTSSTSSTSAHLFFCSDILTMSLLPQNPPNTASLHPAMQSVLVMPKKQHFPGWGCAVDCSQQDQPHVWMVITA